MKWAVLLLVCLWVTKINGQSQFIFTQNGIQPKLITTSVKNISKDSLTAKINRWIRSNSISSSAIKNIDSKYLLLTGMKENYIIVDKRYYHLEFVIKINIQNQSFGFEPLSLKTKQNSKYDMGWVPIDLTDGSQYFKKGKPIKKTKSYIKAIPTLLNSLNLELENFVKASN